MDLLKEILANLKIHRTRTLLTSFGISWGIFILIVLLGVSGGVQQGVFTLKGISTESLHLKSLKIETGRDFHKQDIEQKRNVAIIGDRVVNQFFKNTHPIGKHLIINESNFVIINLLSWKHYLIRSLYL